MSNGEKPLLVIYIPMRKPLPSYLHTYRKRSGFSQRELAFLLSIPFPMLSKVEHLEQRPTASIVIASEIIFGASYREIFPALYDDVETRVGGQAAILFNRLETRRDAKSVQARSSLREMIKRLPNA